MINDYFFLLGIYVAVILSFGTLFNSLHYVSAIGRYNLKKFDLLFETICCRELLASVIILTLINAFLLVLIKKLSILTFCIIPIQYIVYYAINLINTLKKDSIESFLTDKSLKSRFIIYSTVICLPNILFYNMVYIGFQSQTTLFYIVCGVGIISYNITAYLFFRKFEYPNDAVITQIFLCLFLHCSIFVSHTFIQQWFLIDTLKAHFYLLFLLFLLPIIFIALLYTVVLWILLNKDIGKTNHLLSQVLKV
jgi:hypothetical protein